MSETPNPKPDPTPEQARALLLARRLGNQPAFAASCAEGHQGGMSLLEWYAGLALQGMIELLPDADPVALAGDAFRHADAMIAELARRQLAAIDWREVRRLEAIADGRDPEEGS